MDQLFLIICATTFAFLLYKKPVIAWGVYATLLPTYLLRSQFGPFPTTLLELLTLVLIAETFVLQRKHISQQCTAFFTKHYTLTIAISLFLLGATIGVFASTDIRSALGEWRAFYIEPVLLFFTLSLTPVSKEKRMAIITGLLISSAITSILTLVQHKTGWLVPWAFWENGESYRVTGWWGFPNGVGAFQAPLAMLWWYPLTMEWTTEKRINWVFLHVLGFCLSISSLIFAKSTGGIIGALAGLAVLLIWHKRTRLPTLLFGLFGLIVLLFMPANPIKTEVFAQDRSGQIRVQMWGEAIELLRARPFLGAGMASYQDRITPYHTQVNGDHIEIFHHPHNTLLTMWVNAGFVGFIGFVWILVWILRVLILRIWTNDPSTFSSVLLAVPLFATLIHGLVDSPYIKNDTSILFWLILALFITVKPPTRSTHFELVE